jgi:hypothetical protein
MKGRKIWASILQISMPPDYELPRCYILHAYTLRALITHCSLPFFLLMGSFLNFMQLPPHCWIQNSLLFILFAGKHIVNLHVLAKFVWVIVMWTYLHTLEFGLISSKIVLTYWKVSCALLLSGWNLDDYVQTTHILVEMGVYFQIQVYYEHHILSSCLNMCFLVIYVFTNDTDR